MTSCRACDQTGAVLRKQNLHLLTHRTHGDLYAIEAAALATAPLEPLLLFYGCFLSADLLCKDLFVFLYIFFIDFGRSRFHFDLLNLGAF